MDRTRYTYAAIEDILVMDVSRTKKPESAPHTVRPHKGYKNLTPFEGPPSPPGCRCRRARGRHHRSWSERDSCVQIPETFLLHEYENGPNPGPIQAGTGKKQDETVPAGFSFFPPWKFPWSMLPGVSAIQGPISENPPVPSRKKNHLIPAGSRIHDERAGLHVQSKTVLRGWLP
mgnify:CR=1 FL=1